MSNLEIEICVNESYDFNGEILTQSGQYTDTLSSVAGCDSIILLDLSVLPNFEEQLNIEICEGEVFNYNGNTYDEAGNYQDTLTSVNGCDSVINIALSFKPVPSQTRRTTICAGDTLVWNGEIYDTEGVYSDTLTAANGCDSIAILDLNVQGNEVEELDMVICEGSTYDWNGRQLDETGYYIDTFVSSAGCDSIVAIDLFVATNYESDLDITICEGDSFLLNGVYYKEEGIYMDTLMALFGCDSIVTLDLKVQQGIEQNFNAEICEGDTFVFGNKTYTEPGVYRDTFESFIGCDSVVTLTLATRPAFRDTIVASICFGDTYEWRGTFYDTTGIYIDSVPNADGCPDVYVLDLTVFPNLLELDIGDDVTLNLGEEIQLDPWLNIPWSDVSLINWSPPDGLSCTDCPNPIASPTETITYLLTVVDKNGCDISDRITIEVDTDVNIYIPNVFTPDGDNVNDYFYVHTDEGVREVEELLIFDRWGELVFEARHFPPNVPGYGWDGTFRGQDMNPAVFVYVATVQLENGRTVVLKGDITLVR